MAQREGLARLRPTRLPTRLCVCDRAGKTNTASMNGAGTCYTQICTNSGDAAGTVHQRYRHAYICTLHVWHLVPQF